MCSATQYKIRFHTSLKPVLQIWNCVRSHRCSLKTFCMTPETKQTNNIQYYVYVFNRITTDMLTRSPRLFFEPDATTTQDIAQIENWQDFAIYNSVHTRNRVCFQKNKKLACPKVKLNHVKHVKQRMAAKVAGKLNFISTLEIFLAGGGGGGAPGRAGGPGEPAGPTRARTTKTTI